MDGPHNTKRSAKVTFPVWGLGYAMIQTVGPSCIPQSPWFTAISNVIAFKVWKEGSRKCFFMLAVMVTTMVITKTVILGSWPQGPSRSRAIILPPKLHMKAPAFKKVTGNFWDLGYKTETQPKWLFFEAPGAPWRKESVLSLWWLWPWPQPLKKHWACCRFWKKYLLKRAEGGRWQKGGGREEKN